MTARIGLLLLTGFIGYDIFDTSLTPEGYARMLLYLLLIAIPVLGLLALLIGGGGKDKKGYSWLQFFAKGKDAGFSVKEIELLRRVAVRAEMEDPTALFWSVKQLDRCITSLLRKSRLTGEENTLETQNFLAKLYEYRKKIEFDQPRYRKGIPGSRSISESQRLRILVDGVGVFDASVVRNTDRFITVGKPVGYQLPPGFVWKGRRLAVYFWRRDDAGYVFDTYVLDETTSVSGAVLQLAHSDSLFRTQKRRSVRAKTCISAFLYLRKDDAYPELVESDPGMRCIVEDLSEDGCALTVGGKAAAGLMVKVQFSVGGETVAFSGVVKSSDYDEEKNRSLLHIEAVPLSLKTRNRVLSEVFGVNPDAELEAAFSIFDDAGEKPQSVVAVMEKASAEAAAPLSVSEVQPDE